MHESILNINLMNMEECECLCITTLHIGFYHFELNFFSQIFINWLLLIQIPRKTTASDKTIRIIDIYFILVLAKRLNFFYLDKYHKNVGGFDNSYVTLLFTILYVRKYEKYWRNERE